MSLEVERILQRVDIVEFISRYVRVRRSGKNFVGLCPFHKEKTPSFTISPEKQIFYCFGCHEGGNVIHFLMKYERMNFFEALETLAKEYGIEVKKSAGIKRGIYEEALKSLARYYMDSLKNAEKALDYLRERGIDEKAIEEFGLGYSDPKRGDLGEYLKKIGIPLDIFLTTGIVKIKEEGIYDIFRGRIIIPIRDVNSRIIGFGGRIIEKDQSPKYVNSPESPIFSKRSVLFGIDLAKKSILEQNEVFVVEGYFDFFSLYLSGIKNVIATLGTSITEEQLTKLRTYTENITFMLDGDEAGIKSALRLIPLVCELDINGSILMLPQGFDPDSYVRKKGVLALKGLLKERRSLIDFLFDFYSARMDMKKFENRLIFIRTVLPYLNSIKDGIKRRLFVKKLSNLTEVEEHYFLENLKGRDSAEEKSEDSLRAIDKEIIAAILSNPEIISSLEREGFIELIKDEKLKAMLLKIFSYYGERHTIEIPLFLLSIEDEDARKFILQSIMAFDKGKNEELKRVLKDYCLYLKEKFLLEEATKITDMIKEAEKRGDEEEILRLLKKKKEMLREVYKT